MVCSSFELLSFYERDLSDSVFLVLKSKLPLTILFYEGTLSYYLTSSYASILIGFTQGLIKYEVSTSPVVVLVISLLGTAP